MITFVPTPIGNPQDITIRAMSVFEKAQIFLCEDTRQTKKLLKLLQERFDMTYPDAKFYSFNEHNGKERLDELVAELDTQEIVYVSDAGMPAISDPGQVLVTYAQQNNIPYDVLPGSSAVTTAYAASGFDSGQFIFFTFLPHKGAKRTLALNKVLNHTYDTLLYESPHRLEKLLLQIKDIDPNRELFLAKEISKKYQKYYRGSVSEILKKLQETNIRGEWVVVIKSKTNEDASLCQSDIMTLDIPPKIKAKLLSKLGTKSTKEWYNELLGSNTLDIK